MTEDEARLWIGDRFGAAALDRIADFVGAVLEANTAQNLISPATIPTIWSRHVVDSAQLVPLAPAGWTTWIDIGTGGGFPGMIIALLAPERHTIMVEPRAKRGAFLRDYVARAAVTATVLVSKVESIGSEADIISARAVAPVEKLLRAAAHCANERTTWLLPRGRSGAQDGALAGAMMFHVEQSITDPQSAILVGTGRPR